MTNNIHHCAFLCITGLVGYTAWKFYIKRDVKNNIGDVTRIPEEEESQDTEDDVGQAKNNVHPVNNNSGDVRHRLNTKNGPAGY